MGTTPHLLGVVIGMLVGACSADDSYIERTRHRGSTLDKDAATPFALPPGSVSLDRSAILPGTTPAALSFGVDAAGRKTGVYFFTNLESVSAQSPDGSQVWKRALPNTGVVPGYDVDEDGIIDVFVAERRPDSETTNVACKNSSGEDAGTLTVRSTGLHLLSGRTGDTITSFGAPMPDFCHNPGTPTSYPQWTVGSVIFSASDRAFAVAPQYATQAWIFRSAGGLHSSTIVFPSTGAFDSTYANALPVRPDSPQKYWPNSHLYNGLFIDGALGFFTSGRFIDFAPGAGDGATASLAFDLPFLPEGPGALEGSGRSYGLVARDPAAPLVYVVAGSTNYHLLTDTLNGNRNADPAGNVARHVSVVDTSARAVKDSHFYSYANKGGVDGSAYFEDRVSFLAHPLLPRPGSPSRIVYNVYANEHWSMHVSVPGGVHDLYALADVVAWDILDVDQDGIEEILYSPATGYFPDRTTMAAHWEDDSKLTVLATFSNMLPALVATPQTDSLHSTNGALHGAVRVLGKPSSLFMIDRTNKTVPVDLHGS